MKTLTSDVSASLFYRVALKQRLQAQIDNACAFVYDIVLYVYERFRVDGWKRCVNDDRLRVDGDKNMRFLALRLQSSSCGRGLILSQPNFQNSPGEHAPASTTGSRLRRSFGSPPADSGVKYCRHWRQTASLLFMTILPAHSYRNVFLRTSFSRTIRSVESSVVHSIVKPRLNPFHSR